MRNAPVESIALHHPTIHSMEKVKSSSCRRLSVPPSPDSNILANMEFGSEIRVALKDAKMIKMLVGTFFPQDPLVIKIL